MSDIYFLTNCKSDKLWQNSLCNNQVFNNYTEELNVTSQNHIVGFVSRSFTYHVPPHGSFNSKKGEAEQTCYKHRGRLNKFVCFVTSNEHFLWIFCTFISVRDWQLDLQRVDTCMTPSWTPNPTCQRQI